MYSILLKVFDNGGSFSIGNHMFENSFTYIKRPGTITIDSNIMYLWLKTPAGSMGIRFSLLWDMGKYYLNIYIFINLLLICLLSRSRFVRVNV